MGQAVADPCSRFQTSKSVTSVVDLVLGRMSRSKTRVRVRVLLIISREFGIDGTGYDSRFFVFGKKNVLEEGKLKNFAF